MGHKEMELTSANCDRQPEDKSAADYCKIQSVHHHTLQLSKSKFDYMLALNGHMFVELICWKHEREREASRIQDKDGQGVFDLHLYLNIGCLQHPQSSNIHESFRPVECVEGDPERNNNMGAAFIFKIDLIPEVLRATRCLNMLSST